MDKQKLPRVQAGSMHDRGVILYKRDKGVTLCRSLRLAGNAVVTGASSGLGRELARQLVQSAG